MMQSVAICEIVRVKSSSGLESDSSVSDAGVQRPLPLHSEMDGHLRILLSTSDQIKSGI